MPFVPFTKKSAGGDTSASAKDDGAALAPTFSKNFGRKTKKRLGKRAPAQKALTAPGGRSMGGGGR